MVRVSASGAKARAEPFPAVRVIDTDPPKRATKLYDILRLDFADACLVASAERTGIGVIASLDRGIDRAATIRREEPG